MKKNGFLFLIAFALFILLPVNVFASEEFTKYEIILDDPVAGEVPSSTAKVVYSNDSTSVEYDVNLIWYSASDGAISAELSADEKIVDDTIYVFDLTEEDYNNIAEDFTIKGYSKSQNIETYINNYKIYNTFDDPKLHQYYYVGGITEHHIYVDTPVAGATPSETAKIVIKTANNTYEYTLTIEWVEVNTYEPVESVFEVGKTYDLSIKDLVNADIATEDEYNNLNEKADFRTRNFINDQELTPENVNLFGPLEEQTQQEENPNTFDGITNSILIGILSLIGLVGAAIYLKESEKVRV